MHDGYLTICGHELPVGTVSEFVGFALCLAFVGIGLLLLRTVDADETAEREDTASSGTASSDTRHETPADASPYAAPPERRDP